MRFGIRDLRFGIVALAAMVSLNAQAQIEGMEITGFRVPEYNEQGEMTSQLFGEHAVMGAEDTVEIEGVRLEFYRDGDVYLTASSPHCVYEREEGVAHSDAPVRAEMDGLLMTGTGFEMRASERMVHVLEDSRVEIDDVMQQTDLMPAGLDGDTAADDDASESGASTNLTVITSTELFLDYTGRSAKFVGDVHVDDSKMQMDAGSLEIKLSKSNEIDWIEALVGVRILSDGREAHADKAVYTIGTDEFLLEGNPKLVDGDNTLFGDRIRFWRASEKMVCEQEESDEPESEDDEPGAKKRATLVIHTDEEISTELFEKP